MVAVAIVASGCSPDPAAPPRAPSPAAAYQGWLDSWKAERNGMSSEWSAVVEELQSADTTEGGDASIPMELVRSWSGRLDARASALAERLRQVGTPPESPETAPGYYQALMLGTETLATADSDLQSCTERCDEPFDVMVATGSAMLDLLVLGARPPAPGGAVRTTEIAAALLDGARLGYDEVRDSGDPVEVLCTPDAPTAVETAAPDQTAVASSTTPGGTLVHAGLARWQSATAAVRRFRALSVRLIACRMQPTTGRVEIRWSGETADAGDLTAVAWRARIDVPDEGTTLYMVGAVALIDDTVVSLALTGGEPPETTDLEALLVEQAELLGAVVGTG